MAGKMVLERLQAARSLIDTLAGTPLQVTTADAQVQAITQLLAKIPQHLDEKTVADAIEVVRQTQHTDQAKESLMRALTSKLAAATEGGAARGDMKVQDYTAVVNYLPAEVWKATALSPIGLITFVQALDLQAPDAPTYQTMAAIVCLANEGVDGAVNLSPTAKNGIFKMVKQWWTRARASQKASTPKFTITRLPPDPEKVRSAWPHIWHAAFGESMVPAPSPTDMVTFDIIRNDVWVRVTEKRKQSAAPLTRASPAGAAPGSAFEAKFCGVLDQLAGVVSRMAAPRAEPQISFLSPGSGGSQRSLGPHPSNPLLALRGTEGSPDQGGGLQLALRAPRAGGLARSDSAGKTGLRGRARWSGGHSPGPRPATPPTTTTCPFQL